MLFGWKWTFLSGHHSSRGMFPGKIWLKIMHLETIWSNYIKFQIVEDETCPKLWAILDTLGPREGGGGFHTPHTHPWLQAWTRGGLRPRHYRQMPRAPTFRGVPIWPKRIKILPMITVKKKDEEKVKRNGGIVGFIILFKIIIKNGLWKGPPKNLCLSENIGPLTFYISCRILFRH